MKVFGFFLAYVDGIGKRSIGIVGYTLDLLLMTYLSFRSALLDQAQGLRSIFSVVSAQIYFTGWQALPLVSVLAIASGGLVMLQSSTQLSFFGGVDMIGGIMIAIIFRELGPLFVALVVTARSGTAVASELGSMKVNREIQAIESVGINPLSYIVFPRILGGIISTLTLGFYFNLIALLGGYMVTRLLHDMPFSFYSDNLANSIHQADIIVFVLKNGFSGAIIFIVSAYQGLSVQRSPHEIPQVTTKAVLNSMIYVVLFNVAVTVGFYINKLMMLGVL